MTAASRKAPPQPISLNCTGIIYNWNILDLHPDIFWQMQEFIY